MKIKSLLFALGASLPLIAILNAGNARAFTFNTGYDENTNYGESSLGAGDEEDNANTVILSGSRTNSNTAYSNYLNGIGGTSTIAESFETYTVGSSNATRVPIHNLQLNLLDANTGTNYTATLSYTRKSNGSAIDSGTETTSVQSANSNGVTNAGTYPTDGSQGISINSQNNFTINLSQDISNFSFWGTDLGDNSNELRVELYNNGASVGSRDIDFLGANAGNSSVFFFGVNADNVSATPSTSYTPDPNQVFDEIRLVSSINPNGTGASDAIGLDQFTFAVDGVASTSQGGQTVPEPFTILGSMAALGFGTALKKKLRGSEVAK